MKKAISISKVWRCENMDFNAPINWEGYIVLWDDNTTKIVDNLDNLDYEMASEEDKINFAHRLGYIFKGDVVEVVKGRKLPIGSMKEVSHCSRYCVPGTYGRVYTEYLVFTDGTKTAVKNVKIPNIELFYSFVRFAEKMPNFYRGGRL